MKEKLKKVFVLKLKLKIRGAKEGGVLPWKNKKVFFIRTLQGCLILPGEIEDWKEEGSTFPEDFDLLSEEEAKEVEEFVKNHYREEAIIFHC